MTQPIQDAYQVIRSGDLDAIADLSRSISIVAFTTAATMKLTGRPMRAPLAAPTIASAPAPANPVSPGAALRAKLAPIWSEYKHFRGQGFTPARARYLTQPYEGIGHHFLKRSWNINDWFANSRFNVLKPKGISIGRFYERHFLADGRWRGTRFPSSIGGVWSGNAIGLTKPNAIRSTDTTESRRSHCRRRRSTRRRRTLVLQP